MRQQERHHVVQVVVQNEADDALLVGDVILGLVDLEIPLALGLAHRAVVPTQDVALGILDLVYHVQEGVDVLPVTLPVLHHRNLVRLREALHLPVRQVLARVVPTDGRQNQLVLRVIQHDAVLARAPLEHRSQARLREVIAEVDVPLGCSLIGLGVQLRVRRHVRDAHARAEHHHLASDNRVDHRAIELVEDDEVLVEAARSREVRDLHLRLAEVVELVERASQQLAVRAELDSPALGTQGCVRSQEGVR